MLEPDFLHVVMDEPDPCPYLPEQTARMPLRMPREGLEGAQIDQLLDSGFRRTGLFFYRTQCPSCQACEATRLEVQTFKPTRSQKRVQKKGDVAFETRIAAPTLDAKRLRLFNEHRLKRGLAQRDGAVDEGDYRGFLLNAPCESVELSLWKQGELQAVSITDLGADSLSAVYCFFDPASSDLSPGTYAILQQIRLAKQLERKWLYLGYYVRDNRHLNYKSRYGPQQRLVSDTWVNFG